MRGWENLGVVETIYEEEHEDSSSSSPFLSPTLTTPPTPFHTTVEKWSLATGLETDVLIYAQGRCFRLHKDPLTSRSGYLKRHLTESSDITLSPPLNITAETFSSVADFCYGSHVVVTPFNVAALRIAAELLEMTEENGDGNGNLLLKTENYFCQALTVNREYAEIILRSCLALLPEAEEMAFLPSRCIEALGLMDGVDSWVDDVMSLAAEEFRMITNSMHGRFTRNHDLLYRLVDLYLKERSGKITEEQRARICGSIDCNKLSPHLLMHAVQNHRMPLRFIVRAMLVEQLNTRRSIFFTTAADRPQPHNDEAITLGAILERDTALRQVAQLKATMETTTSKIRSLEWDLIDMKKQLHESEKRREMLEARRSASFRFSSESRVDMGERGSIFSQCLRFSDKEEGGRGGGYSFSEKSSEENVMKREKRFGWRLMNGLKSAFRMSSSKSKPDSESQVGGDREGDGVVTTKVLQSHRRNRSLV